MDAWWLVRRTWLWWCWSGWAALCGGERAWEEERGRVRGGAGGSDGEKDGRRIVRSWVWFWKMSGAVDGHVGGVKVSDGCGGGGEVLEAGLGRAAVDESDEVMALHPLGVFVVCISLSYVEWLQKSMEAGVMRPAWIFLSSEQVMNLGFPE